MSNGGDVIEELICSSATGTTNGIQWLRQRRIKLDGFIPLIKQTNVEIFNRKQFCPTNPWKCRFPRPKAVVSPRDFYLVVACHSLTPWRVENLKKIIPMAQYFVFRLNCPTTNHNNCIPRGWLWLFCCRCVRSEAKSSLFTFCGMLRLRVRNSHGGVVEKLQQLETIRSGCQRVIIEHESMP